MGVDATASKTADVTRGVEQHGDRVTWTPQRPTPRKPHPPRSEGNSTGLGTHVGAMCPIVPNALWALDFQFDTTIDGRTLKMLNVIDEYTRE